MGRTGEIVSNIVVSIRSSTIGPIFWEPVKLEA